MTRDPEVLQQQVAGEDIGRRKIAQRVAVVDDRRLRRRRLGIAQQQVQRAT
jgi:hypothetical protein